MAYKCKAAFRLLSAQPSRRINARRRAYKVCQAFSLPTVVCLLLICFPLSAQEQTAQSEDFWISPSADIAFYSPVSISYGGGIAIAHGNGTSIGIKASWLLDFEGHLNILILDILFRLYFFGSSANSGLFVQFAAGSTLFFDIEENISLPARLGTPTIGLALGWRFLLGKYFFIEPSIRGGYPYIAGASISTGVRF
jgi:hypothetical protein